MSVASVKFKNLDKFEKVVVDKLVELKAEKRTLIEVAEFVLENIQQQTRLGRSIPGDTKLKPLSREYKLAREYARDKDPTFFSAQRSNLTLTGQLLRSLKRKIVAPSGTKVPSSVTVFPSGQRDDGLSNQEVAKFVREGGRPFLGLGEKGSREVRKIVLKNLRRILRKTF